MEGEHFPERRGANKDHVDAGVEHKQEEVLLVVAPGHGDDAWWVPSWRCRGTQGYFGRVHTSRKCQCRADGQMGFKLKKKRVKNLQKRQETLLAGHPAEKTDANGPNAAPRSC